MKHYTYVAKDITGKTLKGTIDAENSGELMQVIQSRGLFLLSYAEAVSITPRAVHKFKLKELSFLCRQLSSMLGAGLTLIKALDILHKEQTNKRAAKVMLEVYESVQKGRSLSDAMKMQTGVFPDFFISMVSAGEASGTLDTVIARMSEHYAKENRLHNKIKTAMTYPILLSVMALVVVIGLFTFIMPTFMTMFEGIEMPPLTQAMMSFSEFLRTKWYLLLAAIIVLVGAFRIVRRSQDGRAYLDEKLLQIPKIGKLIAKIYTGRFARTLSSLYASGIPMVECLEKSVNVLGNAYIIQTFDSVIDDVKRGEAISTSIAKANIFESMFCSIIYVGEESGALDEILVKTSEYYEDETDTAIQRLVSLMEPAMIIILGIIVGLVVASILPAMYSMMQGIS